VAGKVWTFYPNHAIAYPISDSVPNTISNSFPNAVPHAGAHTQSNAGPHTCPNAGPDDDDDNADRRTPKTMQEELLQEDKKMAEIVQKGSQMRCLP